MSKFKELTEMSRRPNRPAREPEELHPSEEEIEKTRDALIHYYTHIPKFKGDPIAKATDVIEKCKKGWRNGPNSFKQRIRAKSKMGTDVASHLRNWGELNSAKAAPERAIEQQMEEAFPLPKPHLEEAIDHAGRDAMLKSLAPKDRKFFKQREKHYRKEFSFNSSSDYALLMEVIADEIKIQKIHELEFEELELVEPDPARLLNFSKMSSEAHMRLERSQRALGVTRDQRKDELDEGDADLASLSMSLDKKIKAIAAKEALDKEEEDAGLNRKYLRGDVYPIKGLPRAAHNLLPEMADIDEIIEDAGIHVEEVNEQSGQ
jgi:hypothetical protein